MIREAVWLSQNGVRWAEARERIVATYGHSQPCNAIPNHGFTILGWLYGDDFGDRLCKAVNCGYDTDCTGATLGALLGILGGRAGISEAWSKPVGDTIVLHKFTRPFGAPKTVEELTDRTAAVAERFAEADSASVGFGGALNTPEDLEALLFRTGEAEAAARQDVRAAVARDRDLEIVLHYHGDPVLCPGEARAMAVECRRGRRPVADPEVEVRAPEGWTVGQNARAADFVITAPAFERSGTIRIAAKVGGDTYTAEFTVLSPEAAPGFPSAQNVEYCPRCNGRAGSCLCSSDA